MNPRHLLELGIPKGDAMGLAIQASARAAKEGMDRTQLRTRLREVVSNPEAWMVDPCFGAVAHALTERDKAPPAYQPRAEPAPFVQWGEDLEGAALEQMEKACQLPVAVAGALMADAHVGYGLPIGGVLATDGVVIPYAVGVDIACRMKLTVLDLPTTALARQRERLIQALETQTRFGVGATFRKRHRHDVMDDDWSVTPVTASLKDRAWSQLGTSGSGNHFVEFGTLTLEHDDLGLEAGTHFALLSHSGSRGTGAGVAEHYSRVALEKHPELPRELQRLAWLDLESQEGQEYWRAMELMGRYAAANHALIHHAIAAFLGAEVRLDVENHHNFAWKERHGDRDVIVHRKGATPAGAGVLGIIPGSMGTSGYVVRGRGRPEALLSASHGAGRRMSRTVARQRFTWDEALAFLAERGVELLSAGLDEVPMAYKDIESVMAAQADLIEPVARFEPRLVKMAPAGERPED